MLVVMMIRTVLKVPFEKAAPPPPPCPIDVSAPLTTGMNMSVERQRIAN